MSGPKATTSKQSTKMHRRSRSGCFTCRLRRKKCDEGKPMCKACRCLGLKCEYRRPMWWSNTEQRRQQKETIKMIIKRTKMQEKAVQMASKTAGTPPGLSHSIPTSDTHSDATLHRQRSVSLDSQFSLEYDFNAGAGLENFSGVYAPHRHPALYPEPLHSFSPYEVDVKTERQMFVNDVPTRRDSSISTFSTFQPPPPPHSILPSFPLDSWTHDDYFTSRREPFFGDEEIPPGFFDFGFGHPVQTQQAMVQVEECDRRLLDHFIDNVLRLIFPFLEVNQHGSARDVILPALESNKCYLHCCLSISALHLKATREAQGEDIDNDIVKHRFATVSELCDALTLDTNHMQILEATLGMIFFHCSVGRADDCLPDIPWHSHFQAASSLVHKLELPQAMADIDTTHAQPPFNMTLTSWIDILGATMMGRTPLFANTYREKIINNSTSGLCELMGCEDRIMYLISEIACLEALKLEGMDDFQICNHVHALADQIGLTEPGPGALALPYSSTGAIRPRQLSKNLTAMFRLAARIYLCSLVPGFDHQAVATSQLVTSFADTMVYIPSGPNGFDRLLVWPYLIAGGASTPSSSFRRMFTERVDALGEHAEFGSFGRMVCLLREVWRQAEERGIYAPSFSGAYPTPTSATATQQQQSQTQQAPYQPDCVTAAATAEPQNVHWRDVMQQKGWDFLLI